MYRRDLPDELRALERDAEPAPGECPFCYGPDGAWCPCDAACADRDAARREADMADAEAALVPEAPAWDDAPDADMPPW
jgi:hypothetical protein